MRLSEVNGELEVELPKMRDELARELVGRSPDRPFSFSVEEDAPAGDVPAWTDPATGAVHISPSEFGGLQDGNDEAIAALVHQLVHSIGEGPAAPYLADQMLEEAIVEILTQQALPAAAAALGGEIEASAPMFVGSSDDLAIARPVATPQAVERFARIAAWVEALEGAAGDELEAAAQKWAAKLKLEPVSVRFRTLAIAAAALGGPDDVEATDWLEDYLRGYMEQLDRSRYGYAGLDYALARAFGDESAKPEPLERELPAWYQLLTQAEAVVLRPLPKPGEINRALAALEGVPDLRDIVQRSIEVRGLLWAARTIDSAQP